VKEKRIDIGESA